MKRSVVNKEPEDESEEKKKPNQKTLNLIYGNPNITEFNASKFFNYPGSPKQNVAQIYRQTLRRPHYNKGNTRTNRRINALYPSPYQIKNSKIKTTSKQQKEHISKLYSPKKYQTGKNLLLCEF